MTISELSVRKPVTVAMAYVLVIVISALFVPRLGIALYPDTVRPVLTVSTSYPNAGPEEVEANVTELLESRLSALSGLKEMSSTSSSGSSRIQLSFGYDKDLDEAYADVQEIIVRAANALPDGSDAPTIRKFSMASIPIMRLTVRGDLPIVELRALAEEKIAPLIERVDGVAQADVSGGASKTLRVEVSENRLRAYGLSLSDISSALAARNVKAAGGTLTENGMNYLVNLDESFRAYDDIRQTVVGSISVPAPLKAVTRSNVVRLVDVAEVYEYYDYSGSRVYIDGVPGLYISVSNDSDSNGAAVAASVRDALGDINRTLPLGVEAAVISDNTTMITSTMNQVYGSALQGGLLAMGVILLFLRSVKGTIIIGLGMPISILVTLLCMSLLGLSLNMMTMTGLILGIGMIVDSSIVVLDEIHRYREKGENSALAAIHGSRDMITSITASTLTTLCVFVPVLIYKTELEDLGQLFGDMVVTVVVSLSVSLVVAITLVPALAGSILRIHTSSQKPIRTPWLQRADNAIETALRRLEDGYASSLAFVLRNRLLVLTLVGLLCALSVLKFTNLGMSFSPGSQTDDSVNISLTLPVGTDREITQDYLFRAQDLIRENLKGYSSLILTVGSSNTGSIQISLPDIARQTMSAGDMTKALRPLLGSIPGASFSFSTGRGFRSSAPVNIKLVSNDLQAVQAASDRIIEILRAEVSSLSDLQSTLSSGRPQYTLVVDRDRAAALGVSVSRIASELRTALNGVTATTFQDGNDEISVVVRYPDREISSLADLSRISVTGTRDTVSLDNLVSFKSTLSPVSIAREEGIRVNRVTASIHDGSPVTKIQPLVVAALAANLVLPDSVAMEYDGEMQDLDESGGTLILIILVAVFLVFVVMAAQFESLVDPLIIFFSIPLLAIGVVWTYVAAGQAFSLFSAVGVVALVGIVVNNGIILVDYANGLMRKKVPVLEACIVAGKSRLRPILMTTLTTIIATVPMGFFPGEGGELMQPIGITIVGGLASGSLMTLFVTPVMYSLFNKRRERRYDDPESLQNMLAQGEPQRTGD